MKNGIIYSILKFILDKLRYLTLVELFKLIGQLINPKKNDTTSKLIYSRAAVDLFILLKWIFLLIITKCHFANDFLTILVWYLLITNTYSYFFYHIWTDEALNTESFSKDRTRRRFVTLILAVGYSDLCFAYLYRHPYWSNFSWSDDKQTFVKSIWYSVSNSLAANYDAVKAITEFGNNVAMTQLIITFIFITIILGKSVPQTNSTT
jgi:hypothetical protein